MARKPLSEMSDPGYDKMSEESGYVLHELKTFAKVASAKIEEAIKTEDIVAIWQACESFFVKKDEIASTLDILSNKIELALADRGEIISAINHLAAQNDYRKVYNVCKTISSAELKSLNSSPVELIQAPGPGKYIEVCRIEFFLDFETTAYTSPQDMSVEYDSGQQILLIDGAAWLGGGSDQRRCFGHGEAHIIGVDESIKIKMLVGEVLDGDSPLKISVDYRIVDVLQ